MKIGIRFRFRVGRWQKKKNTYPSTGFVRCGVDSEKLTSILHHPPTTFSPQKRCVRKATGVKESRKRTRRKETSLGEAVGKMATETFLPSNSHCVTYQQSFTSSQSVSASQPLLVDEAVTRVWPLGVRILAPSSVRCGRTVSQSPRYCRSVPAFGRESASASQLVTSDDRSIEEPQMQRPLAITTKADASTNLSQHGVSVQSIAKNGLDVLRARVVPNEFLSSGTAMDSDSDTPTDITTVEFTLVKRSTGRSRFPKNLELFNEVATTIGQDPPLLLRSAKLLLQTTGSTAATIRGRIDP